MRRDRVEIWSDILKAVRNAEGKRDDVPPSRIQTTANVPYARFWEYIGEMKSRGLVKSDPLRTTEEGERFLTKNDYLRALLDD